MLSEISKNAMNGELAPLLYANGTNYLVFGKKKVIFARYYIIIISSKKVRSPQGELSIYIYELGTTSIKQTTRSRA